MKSMRGIVATFREKKGSDHVFAKSMALGVVIGTAYLLVQRSVPYIVFIVVLFTISVAWAIASEFRQQWHTKSFWAIIAGFSSIHGGIMWWLALHTSRPSLFLLWCIAIPELLAFYFLLRYMFPV